LDRERVELVPLGPPTQEELEARQFAENSVGRRADVGV